MNTLVEIVLLSIPVGAVWGMGYGASMILGLHARYVALTKRILGFGWRQTKRGFKFLWTRFRKGIIVCMIGIIIGMFLYANLFLPHSP